MDAGRVTAIDIANFFILYFQGEDNDLTVTKLNKLVYYAQGHYLAEKGVPLFNEEIEAWSHGPVIPSVYRKFKNQGILAKTSEGFCEDKITDEIRDMLLDVAMTFEEYSASALTRLTHKKGTPWSKNEPKEGERHKIIPKDCIKEYFVAGEEKIEKFDIATFAMNNLPCLEIKEDTTIPSEDWIYG